MTLHDGSQRAGADLRALVEEARGIDKVLEVVGHKYPRAIIEQAAIAGALSPEIMADEGRARDAASYIARRLDLLANEYEQGWSGEATDEGGLRFERELRGVKEVCLIDEPLIASGDARKLNSKLDILQETYKKAAEWRKGDLVAAVRSPSQLLEQVFASGRKGISSMQRYKGLGEMNPEQLHETTLDENQRTLLQVRIDHVDTADEMFSKLMGDVVEPRREFIQTNALSVANLDV